MNIQKAIDKLYRIEKTVNKEKPITAGMVILIIGEILLSLQEPEDVCLCDYGETCPVCKPKPSVEKCEHEFKPVIKSLCEKCGYEVLSYIGDAPDTITISRKVAEEWFKESCNPPLCIYKKDKAMCNELKLALSKEKE